MSIDPNTKQKIKAGGAIAGGMSGAALLGYMQGSGLEHVFADKIIEAIKEGDLTKVAGYGLIFLLIWLQVRALKNEVAKLNSPDGIIAKSFAKGEARFEAIEKTQVEFKLEHTALRQEFDLFKKHSQGGTHGQSDYVT